MFKNVYVLCTFLQRPGVATGPLLIETCHCVLFSQNKNKSYKTEGNAKVVTAGRGDIYTAYICRTSHLAAQMIFEKFWRTSKFYKGGGLVWCELDDHPFFHSIHSAKHLLFYSFVSSNHPGGKWLGWKGIESIPFPLQQRRPSLQSDSYSMTVPVSRALAEHTPGVATGPLQRDWPEIN